MYLPLCIGIGILAWFAHYQPLAGRLAPRARTLSCCIGLALVVGPGPLRAQVGPELIGGAGGSATDIVNDSGGPTGNLHDFICRVPGRELGLFFESSHPVGEWVPAFLFTPGIELRSEVAHEDGGISFIHREDLWVHRIHPYSEGAAHFASRRGTEREETAALEIDGRTRIGYGREFLGGFRFYQMDPVRGGRGRSDEPLKRSGEGVDVFAELDFDGKARLGVGFGYYRSDFHAPTFRDYEAVSVPVNLYYSLSLGLQVSSGYRFRRTDVPGSPSYLDHSVNFGLQRQWAPGLTGEVVFGPIFRNFEQGPGAEGFAAAAALNWEALPRTTLRAEVQRDFATAVSGASYENTGVAVAVAYAVTPMLFAQAKVGYNKAEFHDSSGRRDQYFNAGLSVTYAPMGGVMLSAGYVYQKNDSNLAIGRFSSNIVNLAAALRY